MTHTLAIGGENVYNDPTMSKHQQTHATPIAPKMTAMMMEMMTMMHSWEARST